MIRRVLATILCAAVVLTTTTAGQDYFKAGGAGGGGGADLSSPNTWTALQTFSAGAAITGSMQTNVNGIGTTSTDGAVLANTTAATAGIPVQMSPRDRRSGAAWATTGSASHTIDFFDEVLPVTGAAATGIWRVGYALDGAAASYPLTLTSAGVLTAPTMTLTTGSLTIPTAQTVAFNGGGFFSAATAGQFRIQNNTGALGAVLKVDALPTFTGFGTSPAITAKSTPYAGQINVGTGGSATTGVIAFGGTAYPFPPFCTISISAGAVPTTWTATTAGLTLTTSVAWPASTLVTWNCPGGV